MRYAQCHAKLSTSCAYLCIRRVVNTGCTTIVSNPRGSAFRATSTHPERIP